jgi:hypothetical protein
MIRRFFCQVFILALALGIPACAHRAEPQAGELSNGRMNQILYPDRSKRSAFEKKAFTSKEVAKKEFKTGEAHVKKEFQGAASEFHSAAYQGQNYTDKTSRFQEMTSPMAGKSARTFSSRFQSEKARTKTFHDADKVAATRTASDDGKMFKAGDYRAASRAQENPIRGSDLIIGEVEGGAPGGTSDTGRGLSRPLDLRPDSSSPIGRAAGKTMSVDDIRQLLNKGSR